MQPTVDTISVIIPTYFGEQWLDAVLSMLKQQTVPIEEFIIVDSGSKDRTLAIIKDYGITPIHIDGARFDHGGTRTMAARLASGTIVVYLTQDAVPENDKVIEHLVAPLKKDLQIAASYGRQLPNGDATPCSEHLRLFNYPDTSVTRCWQDRQQYGFKTIFISNSLAAYRKAYLAEVGYFPEKIIFGEDTCTLARLLERGYCVRYVSEARVFHSHNYTILQDARRYFDIGVLHCQEKEMMSHFGAPTGAGKQFVRSEISFLFHKKKYILIPQSVIRNGLKFLAYALGKRYQFLPTAVARSLSMHRKWWK